MWLLAALLMLVTMALYWPATGYDFVSYDDPDFVTENPHVQGGLTWEGVKWAFRNTQQAAYWAPLTWLTHMLACQFFGLGAEGHHLINVLLHAVNTGLVFLVFRRMTGAMWRSLILAALFGLHPLRVESVAWITERKDVLSTLFWMLTLLAYSHYVEAGDARILKRRLWYAATLLLFAGGLLSKPMVVTLPCVLLLLDYWPLERFKPGRAGLLVMEKIPFFALAAAASVLTIVVQEQGGVLEASEYLPLGARGGNALISYWRYLGKIFWPRNLAVFYPHPGQWPLERVLLAGGLILGLSGLLFMKRRRYPFLLMGWLWFIGTLVPAIGLIQSGSQAMADRFTYVPSLGVLIFAIWGADELAQRWRWPGVALAVAGSAAIILCLVLTQQQLGHWQDSEALFRHALEVTENNEIAHVSLGIELVRQGKIEEAISQYQEAIRLKPDYALAHNNLGFALLRTGQIEEAISQYEEAIRLKPDYVLAYNNLGNALYGKGRDDEAIRQYQAAIRLKPDYADAHNDLGVALYRQGRTGEAISQFQEALKLKPDHAGARKNLDFALAAKADSSQQPGVLPPRR